VLLVVLYRSHFVVYLYRNVFKDWSFLNIAA
jgi:hypothetical protein